MTKTTYDFDTVLDRRNTACEKWDSLKRVFGTEDVLPLWVADMDFASPPQVVGALRARVDHPTYGYTFATERTRAAVAGWLQRTHGWAVDPDWIVFCPGVVPSIAVAILAYTAPGDGVVIQSPVYGPFFRVIRANGRTIVNNRLLHKGSRYEMDWEDLEAKLSGARGADDCTASDASEEAGAPAPVRMMVLCSPANPVGRVWTEAELSRLVQLCREHNVLLVSDEIHADIVYPGHVHRPTGDVVLMAPSKTFNMQGLASAFAVIPDASIRERFAQAQSGLGMGDPNALALAAMEAAYTCCDDWYHQLLDYLRGNRDYVMDFAARFLPGISPLPLEGMYVMWLDCRGLGLEHDQLKEFFIHKARVGLTDGRFFGPGGDGFMRLNIGCSRQVLSEALERIQAALDTL
ncbi:MAG: aminotransferase class I/II-fold pyridoxal phosphate-dependent enzyme [Firmicutes bacterium]|mgnify:CR=1 FL=1|jgi:cystathionine beta-lyase|nr:aminotransferase class I/II-fold pyridoxal phosphate-dependent enzyme [Bacillota bacterium]